MALQLKEINSVSIRLASPDRILRWSYGEVKKPETINYRTLKPEKDGLFCERIFGPTKDWECYCGKYKKSRYRGVTCDKCGVEVTVQKVRRERLGHIILAAPVCHIWYVKGIPGRISSLLSIKSKDLEKVVYYISFIITEVDKKRIQDLMPLIKEAVDDEVQERVTVDPYEEAESKLDLSEFIADKLSADWLCSKAITLKGQKKALMKKGDKFKPSIVRDLIFNDLWEKVPVTNPSGKDVEINFANLCAESIRDKEPTEDIIDPPTGEVLITKDTELDFEGYEKLFKAGIFSLDVIDTTELVILESRARESERRLEEIRAAVDTLLELKPKGLLNEMEYRRLSLLGEVIEDRMGVKMDTFFKAQMGAEAIRYLLDKIDLKTEAEELRKEIDESTSRAKRAKFIKRLGIIRAFLRSKNKPSWMILEVLPVIPPELRPMVQLEGGRFAASDLNDLYRRVINRNARLKRLMDIKAPESLVRNEKRMLQEAVDALIDNGRRGKVVTGSNNRPLKSLSDLLKGKQGRFRQNLLGKRVDYSGRSVIVVGPELKLHQCGIPKIMALEFFKPFVLKKLVDRGAAPQIKNAKTLVEQLEPIVWDVLEEVIKGNPVLLNRAPTLHRLGIQAFEPVLIEGKAIQIHPLVCQAFNADFDGDQMAVHLPLSLAAQAEARTLMLSTNNLLKPADGKPIVGPSQDMIVGIYYLTVELKDKPIMPLDELNKSKGKKLREKRKLRFFADEDDLITTYDLGKIDIHEPVLVRIQKRAVFEKFPFRSISVSNGIIETTCGRVIFNQLLPDELPFYNLTLDKTLVGKLVADLYRNYGNQMTVVTLDNIKATAFYFATRAGLTIAISDVSIPPEKESIIESTDEKVIALEQLKDEGKLTDEELYDERIGLWTTATNQVATALFNHLDKMNPIGMMANSGARGNKQQVRQLAGMRGLMADPSGKIMELPIKTNFREGLSVLEYFISTHGARKGLTDTALKTADSGYLTRRLVDVAQDVIVLEPDCGTTNFMEIKPNISGKRVIQTIGERILGRIVGQDVIDEDTGELIVRKGEMIDEEIMEKIDALNLKSIKVRSVLTCQTHRGVCQKCYGRDLGTSRLIEIGTPVGIVAAQSIGEPGTQLTMRTFHTGGVAGKGQQDITQGLPHVELLFELYEARYQKDEAIISPISGTVEINEDPFVMKIIPKNDIQSRMKALTKKSIQDSKTVSGKSEELILKFTRKEAYYKDSRKRLNGRILAEDIKDKESGEVIAKAGDKISEKIIDKMEQAKVESVKVQELASKTKSASKKADKSKKDPVYTSEDVAGKTLLVSNGDKVKRGDRLTRGLVNPRRVLAVQGVRECQRLLVDEVQTVYKSQGVDTNDKHIEVIVRQMLRFVKITDPGDSDFLKGDLIDSGRFEKIHYRLKTMKRRPPKAEPILLGISKASLTTESFLSTASFQETTKVLTNAAVEGKTDYLRGLKENVIIGRLVPVGTGQPKFKDLMVEFAKTPIGAIEGQEESQDNGSDVEASGGNDEDTED